MSIISKMRRQTAVYWPLTGNDKHGHPLYGPPVEVSCRWQDSNEMFVGSDGEKHSAKSLVFPDIDTPVGGVLMLGNFTTIQDFQNPKRNTNAAEIRVFENIPNMKATEFLKKAIL